MGCLGGERVRLVKRSSDKTDRLSGGHMESGKTKVVSVIILQFVSLSFS